MIINLLIKRLMFNASNATERSRLAMRAQLLLSKVWDKVDWIVRPSVQVLFFKGLLELSRLDLTPLTRRRLN